MPCIGNVPTIVASGSINYTGASHAATTIYTPSASGTFRVSIYITAASVPATDATLTWTDINGSQSVAVGGGLDGSNTGGQFSEGVSGFDLILQSEADAIQIATSDGNGSGNYTIYYVVEQLA